MLLNASNLLALPAAALAVAAGLALASLLRFSPGLSESLVELAVSLQPFLIAHSPSHNISHLSIQPSPLPFSSTLPPFICDHNHTYHTTIISLSPLLLSFSPFVSPLESSLLIALGTPSLVASPITGHGSDGRDASHRTSSSAPLDRHHPVVRCVLERAERVMAGGAAGLLVQGRDDMGEPQLVHYTSPAPPRGGEGGKQEEGDGMEGGESSRRHRSGGSETGPPKAGSTGGGGGAREGKDDEWDVAATDDDAHDDHPDAAVVPPPPRPQQGQRFDLHHDWFRQPRLHASDAAAGRRRLYNRVATFFIVLDVTDPATPGADGGGGTWFPHVQPPAGHVQQQQRAAAGKDLLWTPHPSAKGIVFPPCAGHALFWVNLHQHNGSGDARTEHAGLAVTGGAQKWGMNIWPRRFFGPDA